MQTDEHSGDVPSGRLCRICGAPDSRSLRRIKSPHTQAKFDLYGCPHCRCRYFDPASHGEQDLEALYDGITEAGGMATAEFRRSRYWGREVARLRALLGRPPGAVLDVGCRTGDFLLHWPEQVHRVGVEISGVAAAVARDRGLTIHDKPVEELHLDHRFDVVTFYAALEHVTQPRRVLTTLAEKVSDGGILAILIPSFQTLKAWLLHTLRVRWHMYSPPEHLNFFARKFLDGCLRDLGFTLVQRRYTSGGMFNPFRRIKYLRGAFYMALSLVEHYTPLHCVPVFDHMYSYYRKAGVRADAQA